MTRKLLNPVARPTSQNATTQEEPEKRISLAPVEKNEKPSLITSPPKMPTGNQLEKRKNKVFDTLYINEPQIEISLFDNAEIDGDIITVIFNGEIILSKQTLSEKPIQLQLKPEKGKDNLLIMYAENQGKVPPNTAIMRARSGNSYYKIFLSADDKENAGVVIQIKE